MDFKSCGFCKKEIPEDSVECPWCGRDTGFLGGSYDLLEEPSLWYKEEGDLEPISGRTGIWTTYLNDLIHSKGRYWNNIKEGPWEFFTIDIPTNKSFLSSRGEFENGLRVGTWEYFERKYFYKKGKKIFSPEEIYSSLTLVFEEGQVIGKYREVYQDGSDKILGHAIKLNENEKLVSDNRRYLINQDKMSYKYDDEWHNNDHDYEYWSLDHIKKDGQWKKFFEGNGRIEKLISYKDGSKEGDAILYFPNGNIQSSSKYQNDKLHGDQKFFYENGQVREQGNYIEGKKEGEWEEFYQDGKMCSKTIFKKGEQIGDSEIFFQSQAFYFGSEDGSQ